MNNDNMQFGVLEIAQNTGNVDMMNNEEETIMNNDNMQFGVLEIAQNTGNVDMMYGSICESFAWEAMQQQSGMNPAFEVVLDGLQNY